MGLTFFDRAQVFLELLERALEQFVVLEDRFMFLFKGLDLLLEIFLLFERFLATGFRHFAFHQLDLIFRVVEEFLLALEFLVQLADMALKVARGSHGGLDITIEIGFLLTEFEQFLCVLEEQILLNPDFLLKELTLFVVLLVFLFSHLLMVFHILGDRGFVLETDFLVVVFMLRIGEPLFLVQQFLLIGRHRDTFHLQFAGKR